MITYSFYESDSRVIRYAETLAMRGDYVEVLALRSGASLPKEEIINGVKVHRIRDRFGKTEKSKLSFLRPLLRFLIASSGWLIRQHRRNRYDLLHVHNFPDFLVFAAWYPRLTGAKVILDIHDILPEFFSSKFGVSTSSILTWGLKQVEATSAAMADHVILANALWLGKYTSRSAAKEKCSVFINYVDQKVFAPRPRTRTSPGHVVMFPGGLQWHQGLDIAIQAFRQLRKRLPQVELHIYGDGNMKPALIALTQQLDLSDSVRFFKPLPIHEIADVMANADLGIVPKRADSFGNEAYSTKIMEFMALGVPLVVSSTKIDRHYFSDAVVRFFESGNDTALANAMFEVLTNVELREAMIRQANEYVACNSWERHKAGYLQLVDCLVAGTAVPVIGTDRV